MGNVLSAPTEGNWAYAVYEDYFIQLSEAGFTNVRIPVDFYSGGFLNSDYSLNGSQRSSINIDDCANNSCFSSNPNTASNYNGSLEDYMVNEEYLDRVQHLETYILLFN